MTALPTTARGENYVIKIVWSLALMAGAIVVAAAYSNDVRTTLGTVGGVVAVLIGAAGICLWHWANATENGAVTRVLIVVGPALTILIVQELVYPVDKGVYLFGIVLGLLGSLVALGMALIYRANRILNFAQGDLGLVPTVLAIDLVLYAGVPFFVGMFLGLGAAIVLGIAIEFFIIRRFAQAPRLILTVATIGLAQLLSLSSLIIPSIWGKSPINQGLPEVFDFSFDLAPLRFHASTVLALILAPACILGVALFLRFTSTGMAVRAAAERSDRANLLGIPVKRLGTVVWVIATVLSFIGVFVKSNVVGPQLVSNGGIGTASFSALLAALTALMLGRLTNLPSVALSAVALGVLEQAAVWHNGENPAIIYPVYGIVVLVALLARKTGQSRAEQDTSATWQSVDEVRPIPRELRKVTEVAVAKWGGLALLLVVAIKLPSLPFMDGGSVVKAAQVLVFCIIGISVIMLTGWAGQVSLGQMAFVGFGGAVGALATRTWHLDITLAMLVAGCAGAAVAVVVGLPALRVKGLFLAVTTLAFAVTASNYLLDSKKFGWIPTGRVDRPALFGKIDLESQANMYYLCLAVLVLAVVAVLGLRRSRTGRALMAFRENERGAQSFGINIVRTKLLAFALSGFLAAVAGCLFTHVSQIFTADQFGAAPSFVVFTATVVGGLGSITGAILGALFFRGGTWFLQGNWQLLPSALGVLIVLLVYPGGLSGLAFRVRDGWLRSVGRRFGIVVPSLLADTREPEEPIEHAEETVEHVDEAAAALVAAAAAGPGELDVRDRPVGSGVGAGPPVSGADTGGPRGAQRQHGHRSDRGRWIVIEMMIPPAEPDGRTRVQRARFAFRHPGKWLSDVTGGGDVSPLLILFGISFFEVVDRSAAGLLTPDLRDAFGLTDTGITSIISLSLLAGLALTVPIAMYADRYNRVRLMILGAIVFTGFSFLTGVIPTVWIFLLITRSGAAVGQATIFPTHNSLLTDTYDIPYRPRVFSVHSAAQGLGLFLGPLAAGVLATHFGWRVPFLLLPLPGILLILWAFKLREPKRGHFERKAMGLTGEVNDVIEAPPSLEESWRMVWRIDTLRRIYYSIPFMAVAFIGLTTLANLFYQREFNLDAQQRGLIEAIAEPFQLVGLTLSAIYGTRMLRKGPAYVIRMVSYITTFSAVMVLGLALAPNVALTVVFRIGIAIPLAAVLPTVFAVLSLTIPARARSSGFSVAVVFVLPGLIILPFSGWMMDNWGARWGMALTAPIFLIAGFIISSAHKTIEKDIKNVWTSTAARSELLYERRKGRIKQLIVRSLDVSYGPVQVLFNVDFEVDEGEMVALLGTNGAGKSTLLKAICGVTQATNGAVIFDGRDVTDAPPHEIAKCGVAMVPGGQGVFPSLTVRENLKVAQWMDRRSDRAKERYARVLKIFPVLDGRMDDPAANLSGGQQQMLALSMAFLSEPKLLAIDELSLGLAPVVVEQLCEIVKAINEGGTTVVLVEQSVNVALTLADRAYFMEKGEIRFEGATTELLERPDVLRSVFLEGASKGMDAATAAAHRADGANGANGNGAVAGNGHGATGNGSNGSNGTVPPVVVAGNGHDAADTADAAGAPDTAGTPDVDAGAGGEPVVVVHEPEPATSAEPVAPSLSVHGLFVRFGGIVAVDDVTFDVAPKEILGIIGPNGAGKTTMFDLISGFTSADAGRVVLGGRDLSSRTPDRRAKAGLGRSFQDARLFPALTVEETIAVSLERWVDVKDPFNAALRLPAQQDSEAKVRRRVDEMIELMGIESFRSKFVRELSTGSRRVVDIACVLAHRPSVVLLDEPSSGIAQREAEALGPLLLRIRDELGASLLVIEHDMPLITSVSDQLLALDQGRIISMGTPNEVLTHPDVVSSYLGTSPDAIARSGARQ